MSQNTISTEPSIIPHQGRQGDSQLIESHKDPQKAKAVSQKLSSQTYKATKAPHYPSQASSLTDTQTKVLTGPNRLPTPKSSQAPTISQHGMIYKSLPTDMEEDPGYSQGRINSRFSRMDDPLYCDTSIYQDTRRKVGSFDQIGLISTKDQANLIEAKINDNFKCYSVLVYMGLTVTILGAVFSIGYGPEAMILSMMFLSGFIVAGEAKISLSSIRQAYAVMMFGLMTLLNFVLIVAISCGLTKNVSLSGEKLGLETVPIFGSLLMLNIVLTYFAFDLRRLMKEREQLLASCDNVDNDV